GFVLLVVGKRLFRKIAKQEEHFDSVVFQAVRHGESGDINASYGLKTLDDVGLAQKLFEMKARDFKPDMIPEAVKAAQDVMRQ
ncbi:unnamed protein product, partial [marine sediment metagenome]